jgi:hypothetical protein
MFQYSIGSVNISAGDIPRVSADGEQPDPEENRLLQLHSELRQEMRMRIRQASRQLLTTVGAAATVLGYSVTSDLPELVAAVPLLLSFAIFRSVMIRNEMVLIAGHIARLEDEIAETDDSVFRYETQYGGAFGDTRGEASLYGLIESGPRVLVTVLIASLYAVASAVAVQVWPTLNIVAPLGVKIVVGGAEICMLFSLIGVLLVASFVGHLKLRKRLAAEHGTSLWS